MDGMIDAEKLAQALEKLALQRRDEMKDKKGLDLLVEAPVVGALLDVARAVRAAARDQCR